MIKKVLHNGKVPVKIWTKDIEESAEKQLGMLQQMPFIFKHIAVMPDVHPGIGSTIGSVIPTKGAIIPSTVGVDIGCGMMAVQTNLKTSNLETGDEQELFAIRSQIEKAVPVGLEFNKENVREDWKGWRAIQEIKNLPDRTFNRAARQMGSLGSGNHFIEILKDKEDSIWIVIHSGSRGIGNQQATYYIKEAKRFAKQWFINLPDDELAYFPTDTVIFEEYWETVQWLQDYAKMNRLEMMERVLKILQNYTETGQKLERTVEIDCHHNYVELENHYGQNVYVTRKGAVRARIGDHIVIPGSMGTPTYIGEGLGERESFESCAHGAGRRMSRKGARALFDLDTLKQETKGVECLKDETLIDETPSAYKDIETVMEEQEDLVKTTHILNQLICVKG